MSLQEIQVKTVLKRGLLSGIFTNALYACSPYRGCAHACSYCDGRAEKYYVDGDFATDIVARSNLPGLLDQELARVRERDARQRRPLLSIGSGVTDSYQPAEAGLRLMPQVARILCNHRQPGLVLTKSALILRDLDLWTDLHQAAGFILFMTITTTSDALSASFEPGASPSSERFATLEAFKSRGIPVGILAMPLLPGICDSDAALADLYGQARDAGVDFIMPGGLTLRPGRQKDHFLSVLRGHSPELEGFYLQAYAEERPSGAPLARISRELRERTRPHQAHSQLPWFVPHAVLRRMVPDYESLHLLFCQMKELYQSRGTATRPLELATARYAGWLQETRRSFNRQRSLPGDWIERQLTALLASTAWEELLGNPKLAAFSRAILAGAEFDYQALKLK